MSSLLPPKRYARLRALPDVRDGLTRPQRIVLWQLGELEKELGRAVPTAMLYGRVLEHIDLSEDELHAILQSLGAGPLVPRSQTK